MKRGLILLMVILLAVGMTPAYAQTAKLSLDKDSASVYVGKSVKLAAQADSATWSSSDAKIAKVSKTGVVTGLKKGACTITARDGAGAEASCFVTVLVAAKSVKLSKAKLTLAPGGTYLLTGKLSPSSCNDTRAWSSANPSIASVSDTGEVTAHQVGKVKIKLAAGSKKSASCTITVALPKMNVSSGGIKSGVLGAAYGRRGSQLSSGVPTRSFPLEIKNAPANTACYAIIMTDTKPIWTHWIAANIPMASIPANASISDAGSFVQGKNDFGTTGYGGPTPPSGTHTYAITVYALDAELALKGGFTLSQLKAALSGHVLAQKTIKAKYKK